MPFLTYLFGAGGLALGMVVGGLVQEVRLGWAKDEAVSAEVTKQERICEGRVFAISYRLSEDALEKIDAANSSLIAFKETPYDADARQKVCNQETACRDRRAQP